MDQTLTQELIQRLTARKSTRQTLKLNNIPNVQMLRKFFNCNRMMKKNQERNTLIPTLSHTPMKKMNTHMLLVARSRKLL